MDDIQEYWIDVSCLPLSPDDILKEMGYGRVQPSEEVVALVVAMFEESKLVATPFCAFRLFSGRVLDDRVFLDEGTSFTVGKILSPLLAGSEQFALFAATAGEGFHNYQRRLAEEGDMVRCFIADVIGTCLVEAVGDYMGQLLRRMIVPLRHTNRFSPGYCGWKLTEQRPLFALLKGNPCGIRLSDVCLMIPEKSISGIIGIGRKVNEKAYGCRYCDLDTCYKRKRKRTYNEKYKEMDGGSFQ